jgi:hypothetical protein
MLDIFDFPGRRSASARLSPIPPGARARSFGADIRARRAERRQPFYYQVGPWSPLSAFNGLDDCRLIYELRRLSPFISRPPPRRHRRRCRGASAGGRVPLPCVPEVISRINELAEGSQARRPPRCADHAQAAAGAPRASRCAGSPACPPADSHRQIMAPWHRGGCAARWIFDRVALGPFFSQGRVAHEPAARRPIEAGGDRQREGRKRKREHATGTRERSSRSAPAMAGARATCSSNEIPCRGNSAPLKRERAFARLDSRIRCPDGDQAPPYLPRDREDV